jgi:hypothetical protein
VTSPNLAAIVQEIIDRGGWQEDNALAFIISSPDSDANNFRRAQSFDGAAALAPVLSITYSMPAED